MWWSEAWEWCSHDLAERNLNRRTGGLRIQSCYALVVRTQLFTINVLHHIAKNKEKVLIPNYKY